MHSNDQPSFTPDVNNIKTQDVTYLHIFKHLIYNKIVITFILLMVP